MGDNNWTRRDFIKGIGATTTGIALSSCAISGDRSAKGLTEEALAVQPVGKQRCNLTAPLAVFRAFSSLDPTRISALLAIRMLYQH